MCLVISIEAQPDERELLVEAAAVASRNGLSVDVVPPPWWRRARNRPALATLTEGGGCSCSLLADDADWNAATWALRADVVPAAVATLKALFSSGPRVLRISALWVGDRPEHVLQLGADELLERLSGEGLGTKTEYIVTAAV